MIAENVISETHVKWFSYSHSTRETFQTHRGFSCTAPVNGFVLLLVADAHHLYTKMLEVDGHPILVTPATTIEGYESLVHYVAFHNKGDVPVEIHQDLAAELEFSPERPYSSALLTSVIMELNRLVEVDRPSIQKLLESRVSVSSSSPLIEDPRFNVMQNEEGALIGPIGLIFSIVKSCGLGHGICAVYSDDNELECFSIFNPPT
jgi:hypothetical protein